ncbi:Regulatory protein RecX [Flavobacterium sp. 9AF]|uniref:regulatory protein RecX n=1 Tax=Flavobacterium sp. 9AF TaxID=2653142 RepID=UPI0012F2B704|nr:regulatory protein RecX [Flavobacterium sp. 9AF]VXB38968.1 Regulatory protein RecX [Flavobacterium sp. 9AF]
MNKEKNISFSLQDIRAKMEYYCTYQERCYKEVEEKLYSYRVTSIEKESLLIYLIENNYINEERFAKSFTRGKHNYKGWGKLRIKNELKFRNISSKIIEIALNEIDQETYLNNFNKLSEKHWANLNEKEGIKKNKKFTDYLIRKGYESNLIFNKLQDLEN